MQIAHEELQSILKNLFVTHGFSEANSLSLAEVFTENTLVGVNSHGINRVPRFIEYVKNGTVKINAEAQKIASLGSMERWDGNSGPGITNAKKCTSRAIGLARLHGMGMVALRNTNHWMRGGTYGWMAADAGCISILFTNTQPNMPPWGGKDSRIGNNPFIVSIPRKQGHVVLDMALSQFSFGKIHAYKLRDEALPYVGGWDENNELSKDPEKILKKERGLPIGYWKGSALSMILDMLATLLSAGNSTYRIAMKGTETAISQVFLCIDPDRFQDRDLQERLLNEIIAFAHDVEPMVPGGRTYYPGEKRAQIRRKNLEEGVPVDEEIWQTVLDLVN